MKYFTTVSLLLFCIYGNLSAQDFPRDTSYTFQSAFEKYVKDYPEITAVESIDSEAIEEEKNITYKTIGKRNLKLDIFKPKGIDKSLPAVLMVHGGGWISGDKLLLHPLAEHLANQNYVTITVEYRLSPEAEYPAAVYDLKTALKWLKTHAEANNIDTSKIAILGTSAGGQLAALTGLTANNKRFEDPSDTLQASTTVQAIVDIDGVLAFIHPDSEEGEVASKWLGGNKKDAFDKWIEASPLTHAGADSPPILFIGSSNPRFLAGREEVAEILDQSNIKNAAYIFEDAPHSFWLFNPWFKSTLGQVTEFLNQRFYSKQ